MPKVTGVGGVFIFSNDPKRLAAWYAEKFGLVLTHDAQANNYYVSLWSRAEDDPTLRLQTVFAIMPARERLGAQRGEYMINYRVEDLEGLVAQLGAAGIEMEPIAVMDDGQGQGKFCQLRDLEGNLIELWEHVG